MKLFDAHNHLHDARLDAIRDDALPALERLPVVACVCNGTQESDWDRVAKLAHERPWARPSYGVHPWHIEGRSPMWLGALEERLKTDPRAAVGEIGLDRWIQGHDLSRQLEVFRPQLALAAKLNRPATLHCLQAWGALWDEIRSSWLPKRGFLLHSYGGPSEMIEGFAKRGAYFSFSPYFLHPKKERQRAAFREVPLDRILAETDAPDMAPPASENPHPLPDADGRPLNHPLNIETAYRGLAALRGLPCEDLAAQLERNYRALFGT